MGIENIRIPPDSTGKRMAVNRFTELEYIQGSVPFIDGDHIDGDTSGTHGVVVKVTGTTSTGDLYVIPHDDEEMGEFNVGETLSVNNVVRAVVAKVTNVYVQAVNVVGASNPFNKQEIDRAGASYVRFAEGSQLFDSFGVTKVSQATTLGDYTHDLHEQDPHYSTLLLSGALKTYLPNEAALILSTDGTIDSRVMQTTHRYHHYFTGVGQLIIMTVACGDTGKFGNKRRWGYFDDNDGIYFQLNGTSLELVLRHSVTGSVVEEVYPQSEWNYDKLDGTGLSENVIDITKVNIWWIDLQWLGSGRVRAGAYSASGERLTCHAIGNAGQRDRAYMRTGSLPIRYENVNSEVVGSTAEMRIQAATVKTEGALIPTGNFYGSDLSPATSITASRPVMSIRAAATFKNKVNRTQIQTKSISLFVVDGPVACWITENGVLTNSTWTVTNNAAQLDTGATAITGGKSVRTVILGSGANTIDLSDVYDFTSNSVRLNADGTQTNNLTLICAPVGVSTPTVYATINWQQLS